MMRPRYVRRRVKQWRNPRNFQKSAKGVANMAYRGLALATKVAKLINVEFKTHDIATTQASSSAGTVSKLSAIAQGDGSGNRDGDKIRCKSWFLRMYGEHNSSGADAQLLRIVILRDNMQRGSAPAVTDVLETANVLSPINKDADGRFTILKDCMLTVTADKGMAYRKYYKEIESHCNYIGTGSTDADQGVGALYILHLSNEASINYPDLVFNWRLRYLDN